MDQKQFLIKCREEAVETAKAILDASIDPIIAFRKLNSIRANFKQIKEFDAFIGLESETDEFPRGDVRKKFSKIYLERLDKEANDYLADCKEIIECACKDLIKNLLNQPEKSE